MIKRFILIGLLVLGHTIQIYAQTQKITVTKAPKNLTELFSFIQEKYGYRFFYSNEVVTTEKVELTADEYVISDLLKELSDKTGLTFDLKENNLIVVEDTSNTEPKVSGKVTGTVKDATTGETIPGVSVMTIGSKEGIVTDFNGRFSLNIKNMNDLLSISFVGFTTQIVPINGKTNFDVLLAENVTKLEEVVVTALNINRSKSSLGYSISTISGKDLNNSSEKNVINSLSGKVAGLQISKSSTGVDGSSRVILRGVASITGDNRPLIVIDGIPVDAGHGGGGRYGGTDQGDALSDINGEDIESISILKGAGAAAAYGSRGAHGVILITTKKGVLNKGLGVSFNSNFSVETPLLYPEFQNEYGHGAFGTYPTKVPDSGMPWAWSYGPKMDGSMLPDFWGGTSAYSAQPNNYKDFFRTGTSLINSVALESSNETNSLRASVTTQNSDGIVPMNGINRQTINLRGFSKTKGILEFDSKINYMHSKTEGRPEIAEGSNNPGYYLSIMPRNMISADLDKYKEGSNGVEQLWTTDAYTANPYWQLENNRNNDEKHRLQGVMSAKIIFNTKVNLLLRSGLDFTGRNAHRQVAKGSQAAGINGSIYNSSGIDMEWNSDFLLSYNPNLESNFKYSGNVGGNYRYNLGKGISQSGGNLRINDFFAISNAGTYGTSEWFSEKQVYSLYGLGSLLYQNWLFFDFTLRNDWSSTLPVANNSYFYHSENLSLLFTEFLNMKSSVLSAGKIRSSYSKVGNDTGPYQTSKYYSVNQSPLPYPTGSFSNVLPPYDLQPEITTSFEVGTNLNFLEGLVVLDFTTYWNNSENQIMNVPLPPGSGFASKKMNAAQLKNTGYEVQLDVAPIRKDNFNWIITATWSKNNSEVIKLTDNLESIVLDEQWHATIQARPGEEFGGIYTTDFKRSQDGKVLVDNEGYALKGDYKLMGNMNPDWIGGISNNLKYKNVSLSFLIDMRKGGEIYSIGKAYRSLFGTSAESVEGRDRWYATHDPATMYTTPLPGVTPDGYIENAINETTGKQNTVAVDPIYRWYNIWSKEIGTERMLDATNIRMREASIGYSLPKKVLSKTPFTGIQLSLVGHNLFFFYNAMNDIDPESGYSSGNTGGGFEHCSIPTTRSIGFNLKVNF